MIPRTIWTLWLQGWENAPELVSACQRTWRNLNPGWEVRALTGSDLPALLAGDELLSVASTRNLEPQAFSDTVRIALLKRYGGVWADATVYCLTPLDAWLAENSPAGFFAFARPAPDRMVASWFLAGAEKNLVAERWYQAALRYWKTHEKFHHYYWFHHLFGRVYNADAEFRAMWDRTPQISADGPHRFVPYEEHLPRAVSAADRAFIGEAAAPVLKLTHRIDPKECPQDSLYRFLCERTLAPAA